jgi:hypothetical protein
MLRTVGVPLALLTRLVEETESKQAAPTRMYARANVRSTDLSANWTTSRATSAVAPAISTKGDEEAAQTMKDDLLRRPRRVFTFFGWNLSSTGPGCAHPASARSSPLIGVSLRGRRSSSIGR